MIVYIPGQLIAILTFPGVVMHEISHRLMCDIFKVPVYEVSYFNFWSRAAGHVIYKNEKMSSFQSLAISVAPLFINTLLCMLFTFPMMGPAHAFRDIGRMHDFGGPVIAFMSLILCWVGISMGMNACPSKQDMKNVAYNKEDSLRLKIAVRVLKFIVGIFNSVGNAFFNFIYALGVSFVLPYIIFH